MLKTFWEDKLHLLKTTVEHQASIQSCLHHDLSTALSIQKYVYPTFVKFFCYLFASLTQKQLTHEMMKY